MRGISVPSRLALATSANLAKTRTGHYLPEQSPFCDHHHSQVSAGVSAEVGSDLGTAVNADISADLGAKVARRQMIRATQMFSGATIIDTSHATGRRPIGSGTVRGAKVEPVKGALAPSISVRCRPSMAALTLVRTVWPERSGHTVLDPPSRTICTPQSTCSRPADIPQG